MAKMILVVDDSPSMRDLVSSSLQAGGFEVVEAANGQDALFKIESARFDLIITDLNMPLMDGIALVKSVRRQPGLRYLPVLLLTSDTREHQREKAKDAGATGWLNKPFDPRQLLEVVRRVLP